MFQSRSVAQLKDEYEKEDNGLVGSMRRTSSQPMKEKQMDDEGQSLIEYSFRRGSMGPNKRMKSEVGPKCLGWLYPRPRPRPHRPRPRGPRRFRPIPRPRPRPRPKPRPKPKPEHEPHPPEDTADYVGDGGIDDGEGAVDYEEGANEGEVEGANEDEVEGAL
ncbi:unnamed protein product [Timema podura]|uniref:Uncharacterized protein n=1 Tax=Timema podura TaxID=61482 RepID=A0ABN7NTJ2_TIMPD|nr:unnamed protein product [Timema podura]